MHHVYREANGCADALAKRGTRQQNLMAVYSECPDFVDVSYVRDLTGLRTLDYVPRAQVLVMYELGII